jgi:tRNA pseudouridine38-40 synthase
VVLRAAEVSLTVAGRTDAGVHAWGQVASYEGEAARVESVNALLPDDVSALSCVAAEPGFDARRDATSRAYCYRVLNRRAPTALQRGRVLHWPHRVDLAALERSAAAIVGRRDFTAFTPTDTEHVRFERDVYAAYWTVGCEPELLEFWIEADAFMRHMNRALVGTMLEVAGGRRSVEEFAKLLEGRPRSDAGPTAAAHGLYLAGVGYGGKRLLVGT